MENMASLLIRAIGNDFADFHDEPINVSRGIFGAFINGCTKWFYKVSERVDKTSALPLAKFVAIAINFGPDRALSAYKNCDQMWVKFANGFADLFFYEHYADNSFVSAVPYLFNLRDLFNVYFRDGKFEPLDRKDKGTESAFSLLAEADSTSTTSTPFPRYVGNTPPLRGTTPGSIRAVPEDSF